MAKGTFGANITSERIADLGIDSDDIADNAVVGSKILNDAITGAKLADNISITTTGTLDVSSITLSNGNLVIGTAGNGIDFSAQTTSSASSATPDTSTGAEVLDHYEVGTFEPSIAMTSNAGTSQCIEKVGTYCRIGDFVSVHGRMRFQKGNGTGSLGPITGLPFTSYTLSGYQSAGSSASIGGGTTGYREKLRLDSGTDSIAFSLYSSDTGTNTLAFNSNRLGSDFYIRFSIQYRTA